MKELPRLEGTGRQTRLIVDGAPFFCRGGELHNSSASSLEYMHERVWPALRGLHMNTVLLPVYWECMEPEPGVFDDTLLDGILCQAREEGMRLILLWFGLWKNSGSTYVPAWMKTDRKTYFRVQNAGGRPMSTRRLVGGTHTISPFCEKAVEADARAFRHLMQHLAEVDRDQIVIMVQVENEMGVLNCDRDYCPQALVAFAQKVPSVVAEAFRVHGSWQEAFGSDAGEYFMAWHYACATEKIASAGKAAYPLPMYVNAWLEQSPWKPGSYPCGGPQFKMHRIWQLAAPSIDLYAPDIYVPNFRDVADEYAADGNALFIPEVRQTYETIADCLYAVGAHHALGYSPFGIEDMNGAATAMDSELLRTLSISAEAMQTDAGVGKALARTYTMLDGMQGLINDAHREGRIRGFLDNGDADEFVRLTELELQVLYDGHNEGKRGGGLVIELSPMEFVVLAVNCILCIESRDGSPYTADLIGKEEGCYEQGVWKRGRILNGDEQLRHSFGQMPSMLRFRYHEYRGD